ncbi:MAG: PD40 domain-containing protein [Kordiimonadaceae bacterium]|nr:PD40 domain-containing protein [Kordiimonadaceae bacterium]MBO6568978.1 PD40 domain-containing protein [Kordiimonadaceae bacterium]MBO6964453.1 PD40 domain-containing protein [Kordiimonadaceae bacterium]
MPDWFNIVVITFVSVSAGFGSTDAKTNSGDEQCMPLELAPGVISSTGDEVFRGVYNPEQTEFAFFRSMPGQENYGIFVSHKKDLDWQKPNRVTFGSVHSDFYPAFSPDGRAMVFSSYRPIEPTSTRSANANLWQSSKTPNGWSMPKYLANISTPDQYDNRVHFLDDATLRFSSTSADWSESMEYVAQIADDGSFHQPNIDAARNQFRVWAARHNNIHLWNSDLTPDGNLAVIEVSETSQDGRPGPADLWFSKKSGEVWSEPKPILPSVNTEGEDENFPTFTSDGKTMTFVRGFRAFYSIAVSCVVSESRSETD